MSSAAPASHDTVALALGGDESFLFVQALATELSSGKVELPGFPDIVMRVQRVLADENVDTDCIVKVIGAEPVLAAQLLNVANSVALNPSGRPVIDLRSAVARVGLNTVRTATIAYAVRLLRSSEELKPIANQLEALWQRNVLIASLCYVVARARSRVNPDTALLTGMLHGVGRLCIMTRAVRHPTLFANPSTYHLIERDWHLSIAVELLTNWGVSPEIVAAVRDSEDYARDSREGPTLTDVLMAANVMAVYAGQPEFLEARLHSIKGIANLGLNRRICEQLTEESAQEIAALRETLG
ncbi:MAG TPA: HDOD domain-containing protein [Steroidobacteraceae bacterium]|jgi:HD-like signal output (HDOD) protein|nr:HDOD domain-containing protein [Steroidobacteraceae bacterium]